LRCDDDTWQFFLSCVLSIYCRLLIGIRFVTGLRSPVLTSELVHSIALGPADL